MRTSTGDAAGDLEWLAALPVTAPLSDPQRHALIAMRHGQTWTNRTFRETFSMDSREARSELGALVDAGVITGEGDRHRYVYRLADHSAEPTALRRNPHRPSGPSTHGPQS